MQDETERTAARQDPRLREERHGEDRIPGARAAMESGVLGTDVAPQRAGGPAGGAREPAEGDVFAAHEARQRAAIQGDASARDEETPSEMQQAGAHRSVVGGGPVGTPEGPPASTVKAGQVERSEGPADIGPRGKTERNV